MSFEARSSYCLSDLAVARIVTTNLHDGGQQIWIRGQIVLSVTTVTVWHFMYLSPWPRGYVTGSCRSLTVIFGSCRSERQTMFDRRDLSLWSIVRHEARELDVSGHSLSPRWSYTSDSMILSTNSRIALDVRIEKNINPRQTLESSPMTLAAGVVGSNLSVISTTVTILVFSLYLHKTRHLVVRRNVWSPTIQTDIQSPIHSVVGIVEIAESLKPTTPAAGVIGDSSVCRGFIYFYNRTLNAIRLFVNKRIGPEEHDQCEEDYNQKYQVHELNL